MNELRQDPDSKKYASLNEVQKALKNLTEEEHKKLMIIAKVYCKNRKIPERCMDEEDLLHEAVLSTLQLKKRWRKGVSIVKHLNQAMRNISGRWACKGLREAKGKEKISQVYYDKKGENNHIILQIAAKEEIEIIRDLFSDDEIAFQVLECRSKEMVESEVCQKLGISHKEYETTCKRIRRNLMRLKNQGVSNAK